MLIQVNIWGSRKLVKWLVDSYGEDTWLNCVKCSEDKEHNKIMPQQSSWKIHEWGKLALFFQSFFIFMSVVTQH